MGTLAYRVPTSSGKYGKPGKSLKNVPCIEKSWNLKNLNNHGKIMEFCEKFDEITSSQKTSCRTLVFSGYWWFQVLIISKCMHGSTSILLLLHSSFMLSVVKMLLKGEAGGHALNSHGNYIVDHGKSWKNHGIKFFELLWEPCALLHVLFL